MFPEQRQSAHTCAAATYHHPVAGGRLVSRNLRGPERIGPVVHERANALFDDRFAHELTLTFRKDLIEQVVPDGHRLGGHGRFQSGVPRRIEILAVGKERAEPLLETGNREQQLAGLVGKPALT